MNSLDVTQHRQYPKPRSPWAMTQTWNHLLFAHWAVEPELVKAMIPRGLNLDTFDGKAWIGVIPFNISHIRLRALPPIPYTTSFPEINVRTYVTRDDKPGVWFFSLDASHALAVWMARTFVHLPYYHARMQVRTERGNRVLYRSHRLNPVGREGRFIAAYQPLGSRFTPQRNSLDDWLTHRFCLYSSSDKHLYRVDIHHLPWNLQEANATFDENTMVPEQLPLMEQPRLHYARQMKTFIWLPARLD